MNADHPLEQLRASLVRSKKSFGDPTMYSRLSLVEVDGLLHVDWYGQDTYRLLRILGSRGVAETLKSITLRSPDAGTNGTNSCNLSELVDGDGSFDTLELLQIQQQSPDDHNGRTVGDCDEETSALTRLIRKAPVLDGLRSPSTPDASFFDSGPHPLRWLSVDTAWSTQDFIANLAASTAFGNLRNLEFGEYRSTPRSPEGGTPFEDYERLFRSTAFDAVQTFTWRNPLCTPEQIAALKTIRPALRRIKIVRFSHDWV